MPCPDKNPLRKNCLAHFSEKCQRYFVCGGRRLADASQGRQARKSLTVPMKCGVYPFPVRPSRSECRIVRLRRTTEAQSAVHPLLPKNLNEVLWQQGLFDEPKSLSKSLFDLKSAACRSRFDLLRQGKGQNAAIILGVDLICVDTGHIKAAAE